MRLIAKIAITLLLAVIPLSMSAASPAYADNGLFNQVCNTSGNAPSTSAVCQSASKQGTSNPIAGQNGIIHKVTVILSLVGGVAAIILAVLSGLTMVTSAGNSEKVANARRRLIYAVIGLIVIALAYAMVTYVILHFIS